jgi:hypothetical protein
VKTVFCKYISFGALVKQIDRAAVMGAYQLFYPSSLKFCKKYNGNAKVFFFVIINRVIAVAENRFFFQIFLSYINSFFQHPRIGYKTRHYLLFAPFAIFPFGKFHAH